MAPRAPRPSYGALVFGAPRPGPLPTLPSGWVAGGVRKGRGGSFALSLLPQYTSRPHPFSSVSPPLHHSFPPSHPSSYYILSRHYRPSTPHKANAASFDTAPARARAWAQPTRGVVTEHPPPHGHSAAGPLYGGVAGAVYQASLEPLSAVRGWTRRAVVSVDLVAAANVTIAVPFLSLAGSGGIETFLSHFLSMQRAVSRSSNGSTFIAVTACMKSSLLQRSAFGKRSRRWRYPCRRRGFRHFMA